MVSVTQLKGHQAIYYPRLLTGYASLPLKRQRCVLNIPRSLAYLRAQGPLCLSPEGRSVEQGPSRESTA